MAWVRLDDQFHDHPKVLDAGPLAEALFFRGLTYATRFLTDGFVPAGHIRRMGDMDAVTEAAKLVACGLWHEVEGGFQIHDYLDYQPSKDRVLADRAKGARRQEEWRERNRSGTAPQPNRDEPSRNDVTNGGVTGAPSRTRPVPVPTPDGGSPPVVPPPPARPAEHTQRPTPAGRSRPEPKTPIPDGWEPTPETVAWAAGQGFAPERIRREVERFRANALANDRRLALWDQGFRGWLQSDYCAPPNGLANGRASPAAGRPRNAQEQAETRLGQALELARSGLR